MQNLPHHYKVAATAAPEGDVNLTSDNLEPIPSLPPAEFGGPGNRWSPETLLIAAVADCFMLSFRAIARASKLSWISLKCEVEGTLERSEGTMKFTEFVITEQRPRMQSRPEVIPLCQGDAVIFAVQHRPVQGKRGVYRVNLRHGVSRIRSGTRVTAGVIFHDAE